MVTDNQADVLRYVRERLGRADKSRQSLDWDTCGELAALLWKAFSVPIQESEERKQQEKSGGS